MGDVFEQYQIAQWRAAPGEETHAFAVISVAEQGGNRIVRRTRPYRAGSKLDDTGRKEKVWTLRCKFENSIAEPGLEAVNGSRQLYPTVLNDMIDSFDRHHNEPGDLYEPTRGWVRARLDTYDRKDEPEEQDCADVTFVFVEDNEDSVDAGSFTAPSVNANARRLAQTTTFDQQSDGIWNDDSQSLEEFAGDLEAWANAPDDALMEVDRKSASTIGAVNRIFKAFSRPGGEGRDRLRDPESSQTARKLHHTKELAGMSRQQAGRGRPPIVTVVFERPQSLVTIAALLNQPFDDLLAVNPQLDDPLYIPPKTPVKVYGEQTT